VERTNKWWHTHLYCIAEQREREKEIGRMTLGASALVTLAIGCVAITGTLAWPLQSVGGGKLEPPLKWKENFTMARDFHNNSLKRVFYNDDIAVYVDEEMEDNRVEWSYQYFTAAFQYMYEKYGVFGEENRLYAIFHDRKYPYATIHNIFDKGSGYRSIIDCGMFKWDHDGPSEIDVVTHELSHLVEGSSKGIHESPSFAIWGDSKWAEIFQYDVYVATGRTADAQRWFSKMMDAKTGSKWFKGWFYPIYKDHDGVVVLNKYFDLLAKHFPQREKNDGERKFPEYTRRMNHGEFVHFWSGAAGKSLQTLYTQTFGWSHETDQEFTKAQSDFNQIKY